MPFGLELQPVGRRVEASGDQTLLQAVQEAGVGLAAICGGTGTCGTCRVRLIKGTLSPVTSEEREFLDDAELAAGYRLACRSFPESDILLDIPPESLTTPQRLQLEGRIQEIAIDPPGLNGHGTHGLAVDIGTTKLAAYLMDLTTGQTISQAGLPNPQIPYGEDVISRIAYANAKPDGREILRARVIGAINDLVGELCNLAGVQRTNISRAVVVGNTAMHHFFAGLPVKQLGEAPYAPAVRDAMEMTALESGLEIAPDARVFLPPNIAGFVGADHVAMQLAAGLWRTDGPRLGLDIGTNTEISLATGARLLSCSCASGPVFEGAHIRDGMRAGSGAIERVRLIDGAVRVQTIDQAAPIGICGSGILDAVAEMLKAGLLDSRGRLTPAGNEAGFMLVPAAQTGHHRDILITRRDVQEIQLAKAAIRAGTDVLLQHAGIAAEALESVIVAGAFGSYLDVGSAICVGMFPPLPPERFRQVGNAAGAGARQMLLSAGKRRLAGETAARVEYVELTGRADFSEAYVQAMPFAMERCGASS